MLKKLNECVVSKGVILKPKNFCLINILVFVFLFLRRLNTKHIKLLNAIFYNPKFLNG